MPCTFKGEEEVQIHTFLTLVLDAGGQLHNPAALLPEK
jgi:hypothetical protein